MPGVPMELGSERRPLSDWKSILSQWPKLAALGHEIRRVLDDRGSCIVRGFPLLSRSPVFHDNLFLLLSLSVGEPVSHADGRQDYIRDIAPEACGKSPAFSEYSQGADFHTDASYRAHPEDYIANLVVKKAKDGGCAMGLVNGREVLRRLDATPQGRRCLAVLTDQAIPIHVPAALRRPEQQEYAYAPVISADPLIRFQYDAMRQGVLSRHKNAFETLWALTIIHEEIKASPTRAMIALEEGDVLFINNRFTLHARTAFVDGERLLKRIRLNARPGIGETMDLRRAAVNPRTSP